MTTTFWAAQGPRVDQARHQLERDPVLTHHLINQTQYTELVSVVILSAFVPTLIAQQLFRPATLDSEEEEARSRRGPYVMDSS